MVLGQMQDARAFRDLHVERKARLEAVFPVDLEAKELQLRLDRHAERLADHDARSI